MQKRIRTLSRPTWANFRSTRSTSGWSGRGGLTKNPYALDRNPSGSSSGSAVAGYPHITLPMGFVFGLPVGISFFGSAWSEPKLIQMAYAFEQAAKARKPPVFLKKVEKV
jgi:Asp-tRNA(Asn)/Glu-tRNA(Gln) amidotransferase A subunit family amidase